MASHSLIYTPTPTPNPPDPLSLPSPPHTVGTKIFPHSIFTAKRLPYKFPEGSRVIVVDPMLATGGTIVAAIDLIKEREVDNSQIKVICAVAAPPALTKLSEKFPRLHVYAGILDPTVNDKGFIIPGLGDSGDRSFGT